MRITNLLHFTENNRFYIFRDFSLSPLDYKMLSSIYQPMVGAYAISLYLLLYQQIHADKVGYSPLEQQRKLFLALDLEPSEKGKKMVIEQTSKLEAIGLLQTSRKMMVKHDDYIYEYELSQPLSPNEFFKNQHFTLLLRDKVGKFTVLSFREQFNIPEPEEISAGQTNTEDISVPFYDLFRLNTQVIDYELEQAMLEAAPARQPDERHKLEIKGFNYTDIITRFPHESYNRSYVEKLKSDHNQMAMINYIAKKYNLTLQETCRLLDEDGTFTEEGQLQIEAIQHKANLYYRQGNERDDERERYLHKLGSMNKEEDLLPDQEKSVDASYYLEVPTMFQGQCDTQQYNLILRNDPYTLVLKKFFPGVIPTHVLNIFEKIDLNYRLKEEVINVLIHYLKVYNLSWNNSFIDSVVSDMLGKQVDTYEQAVQYIRDRNKIKAEPRAKSSSTYVGRGKPKPKKTIVSSESSEVSVTDEEYEELLIKAKKLDSRIK